MIISSIQRNTDGTIGFMGDFWTLTTATEQAGYPASNLINPDLNQKWVSWGQRASHNWIEAQSDTRAHDREISLVGLFGIDRTNPATSVGVPTSNTYRIIVDKYPISTRRRPPVGAVTLTNLTGTPAMLNGPIDPPDLAPAGYTPTQMAASNPALNTVLVAKFYNYAAAERPYDPVRLQTIRLHYRMSASVAVFPGIAVRVLYNGAVVLPPLVASNVDDTGEGYMITYYFSAGDLPGLTGEIGLQITGTASGADGTPIPIGVEWIAELQWDQDDDCWDNIDYLSSSISLEDLGASGDVGGDTIDSYQIAALPKKKSSTGDPFVLPAESVRYVYIEVSDWVEEIEFIAASLGGFQDKAFYAGRLVIAEGLEIDLKEVGGYNHRKASDINAIRTYGGTLRGTRNTLHWTEHDFNARIQAQSVIAAELDPFFENVGMRNPIAIIPDETAPSLAIYGVLTRWETTDVGSWIEPDSEAGAESYYDLSFSAVDARARHTLG